MPDGIQDLEERLREFAQDRDWERFHTPRSLALALCGEAGEVAAELQWLSEEEAATLAAAPGRLEALRDELADVLIYLVRLASVTGVDLISAANDKIDRNEIRFPKEPSA